MYLIKDMRFWELAPSSMVFTLRRLLALLDIFFADAFLLFLIFSLSATQRLMVLVLSENVWWLSTGSSCDRNALPLADTL